MLSQIYADARHYIPFNEVIDTISLIIYPVKDENPLQDVFRDKSEIVNHLKDLYQTHNDLIQGSYHILFVWNLNGERMVDVWIHKMENWSDSGPLLECKTFRGLKEASDAGIASGDSVIALGREEELRRKILSLDKYLDRTKQQPEFPLGMQPDELYY